MDKCSVISWFHQDLSVVSCLRDAKRAHEVACCIEQMCCKLDTQLLWDIASLVNELHIKYRLLTIIWMHLRCLHIVGYLVVKKFYNKAYQKPNLSFTYYFTV